MTPVAPLVAIHATTWDAALEETLSCVIEPSTVSAVAGTVHSAHQRAVNIRFDDRLVALISDEFDNAPSTIRIPLGALHHAGLREGDAVTIDSSTMRLRTARGDRTVILAPTARWSPAPCDLTSLRSSDLDHAHQILGSFSWTPQTPFGRASAALLGAGIEQLRMACLRTADVISTRGQQAPAESAISTAVGRLIGLGEGLTPSGDDVLTGFSFLAAHSGMRLHALLPALTEGIRHYDDRTTMLSAVTLRAALTGRARESMHDLAAALEAADAQSVEDAASRIFTIGHSSGADLLLGLRLALELESRLRATVSASNRKKVA